MNSMKSNLRTFLLLACAVIAAFLISYSASAADLHVDDDAPPGGDGSTWPLALNNLQTALNHPFLVEGDTVKVAQGIYKPGIVQEVSFNIPLGVILEGGYVGYDEPDPDLRDPDLFEKTILSGDIDSDDVHSPAENPGDINGDNSYHVVTIIDDDALPPSFAGTEVDGFMITAGDALDPEEESFDGGGGGAFVVDYSLPKDYFGPFGEGPLFRNCIFQGNRALKTGGAIATLDVGLEVRDCKIINNESYAGHIFVLVNYSITFTSGGGGVSGIGPMIVVNSTFTGNKSIGEEPFDSGGGLSTRSWHEDNAVVVANCFFDSNEAKGDTGEFGHGGGALVASSAIGAAHIMNCVFVNNLAEDDLEAGGGLVAGYGALIRHCTLLW